MNSYEMGWLAGIIDGEGCIGLYKQKRKDRIQWTIKLQIGNDDMNIINRAKEIIGTGSVQNNGRGHYLLVVQNKGVKFLENMKLIGKDAQRKLILEAVKCYERKNIIRLEEIHILLHSLNS